MRPAQGPRAFAVLDLGFGDAGKGLATDHLARRSGADVVVRFNGGAQAGHNVMTPEGRHHTFAQFGAASFLPGVRTFLSRHMAVHPTALLVEAGVLASVGVRDPLSRVAISENALVTTPFHQAANRLRELARGEARHGSCGVGVGETMHGALVDGPEAVRAGDLRDPQGCLRKLERVQERLSSEMTLLSVPSSQLAAREWSLLEGRETAVAWLERARRISHRVTEDRTLAEWLARSQGVIFEGAQGLLLDGSLGFHPHTTWSDCTSRNARELLHEAAPGLDLCVWGVLRAFAVRHGAGPLPTETDEFRHAIRENNADHVWQGPVRYGWFDAVLARYALRAAGIVDTLLLTHVDALARHPEWLVCDRYDSGRTSLEVLPLPNRGAQATDLAAQERLGGELALARPILSSAPTDAAGYVARIEELLGRPIGAVSRGPRSTDIESPSSAPAA